MGFINMCKAHFQRSSAPRSQEEQQQWQKVSGAEAALCARGQLSICAHVLVAPGTDALAQTPLSRQ